MIPFHGNTFETHHNVYYDYMKTDWWKYCLWYLITYTHHIIIPKSFYTHHLLKYMFKRVKNIIMKINISGIIIIIIIIMIMMSDFNILPFDVYVCKYTYNNI